jgi:hypothetical protein
MISKLLNKTIAIGNFLRIDFDFSDKIMEPSLYFSFDDNYPYHSLIFYYSITERYQPNTCRVFKPHDEKSVEFYLGDK